MLGIRIVNIFVKYEDLYNILVLLRMKKGDKTWMYRYLQVT